MYDKLQMFNFHKPTCHHFLRAQSLVLKQIMEEAMQIFTRRQPCCLHWRHTCHGKKISASIKVPMFIEHIQLPVVLTYTKVALRLYSSCINISLWCRLIHSTPHSTTTESDDRCTGRRLQSIMLIDGFPTRCRGLAKMPDIRSARYPVFALFLETLAARKMLVLMPILNRISVFELK